MVDDALFQSGMGSVDAPRTEDFFARPALRACARIARLVRMTTEAGLGARIRAARCLAGNSAKALIQRRIPGTIPS